ncbi:MAG: DedA family protein [Thermoplasmata archaeon]|nr:DedA family protein [Thermoplasmata archaeon]
MVQLAIVETVVAFITEALRIGGLPALVALMAVESFGLPPLPSEVILLFAGFLVAENTFSPYAAFGAALLGGVLGSYIAYVIGRYARHWLYPPGRTRRFGIDVRHLETMDRWFARYGEATVGFSRLIPAVRSYISYPAGAAKMSPVRFGVYTALGAAPFTAGFLYAGFVLRSHWNSIIPWFNVLDDVVLVVLVVLALYLVLRWTDRIGPGWPPRIVHAPRAPAPPPPAS